MLLVLRSIDPARNHSASNPPTKVSLPINRIKPAIRVVMGCSMSGREPQPGQRMGVPWSCVRRKPRI